MKHVITIKPNGDVQFIADLPCRIAGDWKEETKRAGNIEPVGLLRRLAFRLIRSLVSDQSRVAAWTRTWRCRWRVNMGLSGGPIFGSFASRQEAVRHEREWVIANALIAERKKQGETNGD